MRYSGTNAEPGVVSLSELFASLYGWLSANQIGLAVAAIAIPVAGTAAARIGKAGKTDADGKFLASVVVGVALLAFLIEVLAIYVAHRVLHKNLLDAPVLVLVAPIVCAAGALLGIRWVFPLNELASVRTFVDLGAFFGACVVALWLFSKFRGWGIVFWGSVPEMIAIGAFGIAVLRRLYRRAFGGAVPVQRA